MYMYTNFEGSRDRELPRKHLEACSKWVSGWTADPGPGKSSEGATWSKASKGKAHRGGGRGCEFSRGTPSATTEELADRMLAADRVEPAPPLPP